MEQLDQAVLATLHGKIDRINDNIDAVKEKQEEMLKRGKEVCNFI